MKAVLKMFPSVWPRKDSEPLSGVHVNLIGDLSGLRGDASGLRGNVRGLRGYVTGLSGDVDDCEITEEERAAGVDVTDLVEHPATPEKEES